MDTPETVDPDEPVEPFGREASAYTKDALEGRRVRLEIGQDPKDDYGRLLAYLWTEDGMFDEDLLARGYGRLMIIEPNDAYEGCLTAAEHAAKDEELGLWADDAGQSPEGVRGCPGDDRRGRLSDPERVFRAENHSDPARERGIR